MPMCIKAPNCLYKKMLEYREMLSKKAEKAAEDLATFSFMCGYPDVSGLTESERDTRWKAMNDEYRKLQQELSNYF